VRVNRKLPIANFLLPIEEMQIAGFNRQLEIGDRQFES
jgi:hypothetical protein